MALEHSVQEAAQDNSLHLVVTNLLHSGTVSQCLFVFYDLDIFKNTGYLFYTNFLNMGMSGVSSELPSNRL